MDKSSRHSVARPPEMQLVVDNVKSLSWLANQLGLRRQSVAKWQRVPEEYLLQVEDLTGVPRELLRPDLFQTPKPPHVRAPEELTRPETELAA